MKIKTSVGLSGVPGSRSEGLLTLSGMGSIGSRQSETRTTNLFTNMSVTRDTFSPVLEDMAGPLGAGVKH